MNTSPIRTLIVDDEAPARRWLRLLCGKVSDVVVVGECGTASEASRALRRGTVDLLLLDVQLGPHTGFQVLDGVPRSAVPCVVFVTAYDQFAVRAFERSAVDYLLKPVREDRFREALDRVRLRFHGGLTHEIHAALRTNLEPLERAMLGLRSNRGLSRVIAERDDSYHVIDTTEIESFESSGNYVHVRRAGDSLPYRMRGPLHTVLEALGDPAFIQISRSAIVNLSHVARIDKDENGDFTFVMKGADRQYPVGRSFRSAVGELLRSRGLEMAK